MGRERKFTTVDLFQSTKHLLLEIGYEGFTISILAEHLNVARGTIYKYYENKDELITAFMLYEMQNFLTELIQIDKIVRFESKFEFLLTIIFNHHEVQHFLDLTKQISVATNEVVRNNIENLGKLHLEMYRYLQDFVDLGKKKDILKKSIPDGLILGFIFQSIAIPNHFGTPHEEWVDSIKQIISHGMFTGG